MSTAQKVRPEVLAPDLTPLGPSVPGRGDETRSLALGDVGELNPRLYSRGSEDPPADRQV